MPGSTDKGQAGNFAGFGKIRIFGKETVAGVDGLCAGALCGGHELFNVEVALGRLGLPEKHGFIRLQDMQAKGIGLGIDGDSENPHFLTGPDDPEGDFSSVGNQYFFEHLRFTISHQAQRGDLFFRLSGDTDRRKEPLE
jgi:hypothetical protein